MGMSPRKSHNLCFYRLVSYRHKIRSDMYELLTHSAIERSTKGLTVFQYLLYRILMLRGYPAHK